jgi:crotonobetainyl-CoA:carnitine CoA-transferase CaiB-like acyl-CoA transferase
MKPLSKRLIQGARWMLDELQHQRLTVALSPAERGQGKIRTVMAPNPDWYQRFCTRYQSTRRRKKWAFDTSIKREKTVRALKHILAGRFDTTRHAYAGPTYIERLIPEIRAYLKRGDEERRAQREERLRGVPF